MLPHLGVFCTMEKAGVNLLLIRRLSLSTFKILLKDEVCHQLLAKGALLIRDAQSLDHIEFSAFISDLVALRKGY